MSDGPRTALVQGASRGIGLALVEALLAEPRYDSIVATCRAPAAATQLQELATQHAARLRVLALDVEDESSVARAAESFAAAPADLALLVNCAGFLHEDGIEPERRLADVEPAHVLRAFAVNALGPLLVAKHFGGFFDRRARGVFASLSARVGSIGDNRLGGWYGYRASKAAQNMFTRNIAIELRRRHRGLICVALHPGTVDTDLSRPFQANVPPHKLFDRARAARQLLTVVDGLEADDNGGFFAWDGADVPW